MTHTPDLIGQLRRLADRSLTRAAATREPVEVVATLPDGSQRVTWSATLRSVVWHLRTDLDDLDQALNAWEAAPLTGPESSTARADAIEAATAVLAQLGDLGAIAPADLAATPDVVVERVARRVLSNNRSLTEADAGMVRAYVRATLLAVGYLRPAS